MEIISMVFTAIGVVSAVVGILGFVFYCVNWFGYAPSAFVRFGGEDLAAPIVVGPVGRIPFAVSVLSRKQCRILATSVEFDPAQVDLQAKGAEQEPTTDLTHPIALRFEANQTVTRGILATHFFDYTAKSDQFAVKFVATVALDNAEIPFLLSMSAPRTQRIERAVLFRVVKSTVMDIKQYGLMLKPGESLQMGGVQAQEAVSATTREGEAQVRAYQILRGTDEKEKVSP